MQLLPEYPQTRMANVTLKHKIVTFSMTFEGYYSCRRISL